ncbi:hypothetical protein NDU88_003516 [Pleurodeles waltl]|uniref:Uncharacterized protein n=1 Tax=Pleurodeles waltl TaxID=8319 RepID=A0AAV7V2L7_PLEWA|nr:hypothetical protein NDU88_003516 [Pleurodeles waltl]
MQHGAAYTSGLMRLDCHSAAPPLAVPGHAAPLLTECRCTTGRASLSRLPDAAHIATRVSGFPFVHWGHRGCHDTLHERQDHLAELHALSYTARTSAVRPCATRLP